MDSFLSRKIELKLKTDKNTQHEALHKKLTASMTEDEAWDWVTENTSEGDRLYVLVYEWIDETVTDEMLAAEEKNTHPQWTAWELETCSDFVDYLKRKGITDPEDIKNIASAYESNYDESIHDAVSQRIDDMEKQMAEDSGQTTKDAYSDDTNKWKLSTYSN